MSRRQPHTEVFASFHIPDPEDPIAAVKWGCHPPNVTCPSESSVPLAISVAALRALGVEP